jgi:hypothetical protein
MPGTPAWLWLNLFSLDAPIVALVWQDFAARSFGSPLRPTARIVLGLTVWAVYLADRLLDIRGTDPAVNTARHDFYRRHPRAFLILLSAVLALDAIFAIAELRRDVFVHGLVLAGCVGAYLLTFPRRASGWEKQGFAAILFSAGVLLVSATWLSPSPLLLPGGLLAGLCFSNLVVIEILERDPRRRVVSLAPAAIALLALARSGGAWENAVAVSGGLLAGVAISSSCLTPNAMRVLADAALLTPLFFW